MEHNDDITRNNSDMEEQTTTYHPVCEFCGHVEYDADDKTAALIIEFKREYNKINFCSVFFYSKII